MKYLIISLTTACLLASCFYKPVLNSEADDITNAEVIDSEGIPYLMMVENVFQATSKEGGRGLTIVTGHNDQRISVYRLTDGSLVTRKKTGRPERTANHYLGFTEDNLWFYSFENSIHTLDPKLLSIKLTREMCLRYQPELQDNLTSCEWYQVPQFFQFNSISREVILTDKQGYRYTLNTGTMKASKIETAFRSFNPRRDRQLDSHITFPQPSFELSGDLRKQLKTNNEPVKSSLSFLEGKLILDRNPLSQYKWILNCIENETHRQDSLLQDMIRLKSLNGGMGPQWRTLQRDTLNSLDNAVRDSERNLASLKKAMEEISNEGFSHNFSRLLSPDNNTLLILHASTTAKDAGLMISRLLMRNSVPGEMWTTEIPDLFFDPGAARETSTFKEVFSKGNPEFRFSFFDISGDKLIIIWMLHACCLDLNTGKILWKFRI